MSQCQAPSAPKPCQAARGDCSWSNAAKPGALHSGSHPSSVTRDTVVLRADEHVGGPQPAILARTAVAQEQTVVRQGTTECHRGLGLQGDDVTEKCTWQSTRTQGTQSRDRARRAPLPQHRAAGIPMGAPAACLAKGESQRRPGRKPERGRLFFCLVRLKALVWHRSL